MTTLDKEIYEEAKWWNKKMGKLPDSDDPCSKCYLNDGDPKHNKHCCSCELKKVKLDKEADHEAPA